MQKQDVRIETPCHVDWRSMTKMDRGRFCGDCKKVVRDLSSLSEREARTVLERASREDLCVRYLYDKHGRVFFAPAASSGVLPAGMLHRAKRVALAAAAAAAPLAMQACSLPSAVESLSFTSQPQTRDPRDPDPAHEDSDLQEMMGGVSADQAYPQPQEDAGSDATADVQADGASDAAPIEPL